MAQIGFLGTGKMGVAMASRLLLAGHTITAYNRTRSKVAPLKKLGAKCAGTPREAVENADAIIAMVGDDNASRAVWSGENGALAATLRPGVVAIECSTLSHDWVTELSQSIEEQKLVYIDCPVTGMPEAAACGELTLFLGGSEAAIALAQPILKPLCNAQIHFGDIGSGTAYKLIVNLMGSVQILAAAEGLVAAEKAGLDLSKVSAALASGAAASPNVVRCANQMVAGELDKNVLFSAFWRLKDTRYGVSFMRKLGLTDFLGQPTQVQFQKLVDAGFAEFSESKIIDIVRD